MSLIYKKKFDFIAKEYRQNTIDLFINNRFIHYSSGSLKFLILSILILELSFLI